MVWDGALTNTKINSIEAIQGRTARLVCTLKRTDHNTSTTKVLEDLEWDTLKDRRERRRLSIVCAMHCNKVAVNITDYLHTLQMADSQGNINCSFSSLTAIPDYTKTVSLWALLDCGAPYQIAAPSLRCPKWQAEVDGVQSTISTDRLDAVLPPPSYGSGRSTYKHRVLSKYLNLFFRQFG